MKFAIAFAAVLAVAYAGAVKSSDDANAKVLRYDNEIGPDGAYNYAVEIDNGIAAQAQGIPQDFGGNPPVVGIISKGSYAWTSPEGKPIVVSYVADENGYQPSGDVIPTPHPIPEAILRAIEYVKKIQNKK